MNYKVSGPLEGAELERAKQSLLEGNDVSYGTCDLYPDLKCGLIWGVDPYGCEVMAANSIDEAGCLKALDWAKSANEAKNHPAEYCY